MHHICTCFEDDLQMLPGAADNLKFAEVGCFAEASEIGQIATVFDDRNTSVGDPNTIDAVHVHTKGISNEDFDDNVVGRHEHGLIGVSLDEAFFEVEHAFEDIAEAFATGHMRADRKSVV